MIRLDSSVSKQNKAVATAQARLIAHMLPDTCTITPATDEASEVISRIGIVTSDVPANRQYLGSEDIPCRADPQRSFRPDELRHQVSSVDELDLQLPYDVIIEETDIVTLRGEQYKIRKLENDGNWDFSKVAKIMRLTTNL